MSDHQKHREAMSRKCLEAMSAKGLTFKSLAATIQLSPFITAAAMLGQMPVPQNVASKASDVLSLPEANEFLTEIPIRGSLGATVPIDPTIYRFYEIVQVYGTTLKAEAGAD